MQVLKKIGMSLLFPPIWLMIILIPIATAFLIFSMVVLVTETVPAYISYVLSAYTLTVWCVKIPNLITLIKRVKRENKYAKRWFEDVRLRTNITLCCSLIWNTAYAIFQLCLGIVHSTFWFYSLAGYYICLALMRLYIASHTRRYTAGEKMREELMKFRTCGWIFLVMNLALSLMIFFMVYWNRTFIHHEITTIAMAAYTFTTFTIAIINIVKYRRYKSPVLSAAKAISLASASVSMITLTATMLTTFGEGDGLLFRRIILSCVGGAVSIFIITMAIYMIVLGTRKIRKLKTEDIHE